MYTHGLMIALLFFVLSPGVLLTIPAGSRGLFFSRQTSLIAAAVHAIVFVVVGAFLLRPSLFEAFETCHKADDCKGESRSCNPVVQECQDQYVIGCPRS